MAVIHVVDDDQLLLNLVSTVLRQDGHRVTAYEDPAEAREAIIAAQPLVDLVITDAGMEPMSGFKLVKDLRRNQIFCPVIFISGYHGLAVVITESFGKRSVMEKPFTAAELLSAVRKSLALPRRSHVG